MLGLFENPVDPFPTGDAPAPAAGVRRFLLKELRPLRLVVVAAVATTILCAAIEVWLIGYAGRLVDTLAVASPDTLWARHGTELLAVAALVLIIRPAINLVSEALDDIAFRASSPVGGHTATFPGSRSAGSATTSPDESPPGSATAAMPPAPPRTRSSTRWCS